MAPLPPVSSPTLVLASPTRTEQIRTWTQTQPSWGASFTPQAYIDREINQFSAPLTRDGGLTPWILTDSSVPEEERPVLASCETIRKRALVRSPGGSVRDVWAHGVASVFTYPEFRKQGYASRMMALLGEELARRQRAKDGEALFSILFSDIGKVFYAREGWVPHGNTHLDIYVQPAPTRDAPTTTPLFDADLPPLNQRDEHLLRQSLTGPGTPRSKTLVAVIPDNDTLQWHFHRESFTLQNTVNRTPNVRGALYTSPQNPSHRVWALWVRALNGGEESPEKNVLRILRFVVEDESMTDEDLAEGIAGVLAAAQDEAREWWCAKMDLWSPDERTRRLIEADKGLKTEFVVREDKNIASLRWFGEGAAEDVEWVANEKFEWC